MITVYDGQGTIDKCVLVCHGAMQMKFDQFHPLIQHYQKNFRKIYSVELPGHGSQRQYEDVSTISIPEMLEILYSEIDKLCPKDNLFVTGYSVGGLLFIKLWKKLCSRNTNLKGIFIGTGITIRPESTELISKFFSIETYLKLGWEKIMIRQHGPDWKKTVQMIHNWYQPESGILPTDEELKFLIEQDINKNIYFIIGKKDQPFKKEDIINKHNFSLYEIESDHFSYFIIKKAWPDVRELMNRILQMWYGVELKD